MYALDLDIDGRILSVTFPRFAPADAVIVDALPEGDVIEYRYVDGEFVYDPTLELEHPTPTLEDRVDNLETDSTEMKLAIDALLGVAEQ
jgi:hypothetical protein